LQNKKTARRLKTWNVAEKNGPSIMKM